MMVQVPATYRSLAGLGDCCVNVTDDTGAVVSTDCSACPATGGAVPDTFGGTGPGSGGMTPGSGGLTPAQIAQIIASVGGVTVAALNAAGACPAGYLFNSAMGRCVPGALPGMSYNPASGTYVQASLGGVTAAGSLTGSMLPVVLGIAGLVVLMMVLKK
jgi:hypothetical protein